MSELSDRITTESDKWMAAAPIDSLAITTVSQFVELVTTFFNTESWLYRGEGQLYDEPLTPTVYRGASPLGDTRAPKLQITDEEIAAVEQCQSDYSLGLVKDRFFEAFIPTLRPHDVNWLPLARHFAYDTRLLDVTRNPLVGLYFACDDPSNDADAYVYVFLDGGFRPVNDRNPLPQGRMPGFPRIPPNFLDLFDVDIKDVGKEYDDLPYLFDPSIPQERVMAQSGVFLFWRERGPVLDRRPQLIPIRVKGDAKGEILIELTALGITRSGLFPSELV